MGEENVGMEAIKAAAEGAGRESVSKVDEIICRVLPFWGQKRRAFNVYADEIKNSSLSPEAKMFAIGNAKKIFREMKNQMSIADIAYSTLTSRHGKNYTLPPVVDYELLLRLMDSGKFVSDEDMQMLWGNILAGELDDPGSTPKNVVRILSELTKEYANIFSNLCSLLIDCFYDTRDTITDAETYLMLSTDISKHSYLISLNITLGALLELDKLGLIEIRELGFINQFSQKTFPYIHFVSENHVITAVDVKDSFPAGNILLTKAGKCISRFIPRRYNQQHMDSVKILLKEQNIHISDMPTIRVKEIKEEGICKGYNYERL